MSHRIVNNVGYKKLFPMSLFEDDTFCHYCGRAADILNPLEWDHVPALNVKIPEEYSDIKKTLIRACRECNGLASDVPHLDYLERHFWLKAAYLRRYKRFLVCEGLSDDINNHDDPYLRAAINNSQLRYQQLLDGLGFGIKDISQIDSPILNVTTKKKRKISTLIIGHLRGFPSEQDDNDEPEIKINKSIEYNTVEDSHFCTYDHFVEFVASENSIKIVIEGQEDYEKWIGSHPMRFEILNLPTEPEKAYFFNWFEIVSAAKKLNKQELSKGKVVWPDPPCSTSEFVLCLAYECETEFLYTELAYINWCTINPDIVNDYSLPERPVLLYDKDWEILFSLIARKKKNNKIDY